MRSCACGLLPAYAFPKQAAPAFSRGHWLTDKRITRLCNRVRLVTPTNKETRVIWAVCSSTRENLNRYSFRANHALRSPESQFSDNLNNQPGLRWKPQRLPSCKQHSITNLPDFAEKWPHYSQPCHRIWANCKFLSWDTFLTGPKSHVHQFRGSLERFAQPSAKNQERNNEWVRVSEHNHPADY